MPSFAGLPSPPNTPATPPLLSSWLKMTCSAAFPAAIVPAHIFLLLHLFSSYYRNVDRRYCSCSCWDSVFKGTYETGIASYKHMYFNATSSSFKIWILTVGGIVSLYECTKYLLQLMHQGSARYPMAFLFLCSLFSHYYSWWSYINFYNDDDYSQWYRQLLFAVTEALATGVVLQLANAENAVTERSVLCITGVALLHLLTGGIRQFITNVMQGEGYPNEVARDLGFIIPDVLHIVVPVVVLAEAKRSSFSRRSVFRDRNFQRDFLLTTVAVGTLFVITLYV